jgi:hypothetical protein
MSKVLLSLHARLLPKEARRFCGHGAIRGCLLFLLDLQSRQDPANGGTAEIISADMLAWAPKKAM